MYMKILLKQELLKMIVFTYVLMYLFTYCLCNSVENDSNCVYHRDKFGMAVSNFTLCAVANSHPIKLCESCVDYYISVLDSYKNLSQINENKTTCYSEFVHMDRLEVIEYMYGSSYELWNTAKCSECFVTDNGVLTRNNSAKTTKFNILYEKTAKCINETFKNSTQPSSHLCDKCMDSYMQLTDYYISISNENENIGMCMDIVDLMNNTRTLWSAKCCLYRQHTEYIFIISTSIVLMITVLFYTSTKLLIDKKSSAVFLQTRFAESLNINNSDRKR